MSSSSRDSSSKLPGLEAESTERWISGKSEEELLADLKAYSSRLRDDPHSIPDRLRVAAIQLRLGRIEEALVHYEGVLRGYVAKGQVMSAIALCRRILSIYPDLPRLQRILAALYARVPHGASDAPTPVTPIEDEDAQTRSFVMQGGGEDDDEVAEGMWEHGGSGLREVPTTRELLGSDELKPTMPYDRQRPPTGPPDEPMLLTRKKDPSRVAKILDDGDGEVVLLTEKKR